MGMSSTQTRLLGLTTRMHDVEYKSENIANIKLRLADESDKIAQKYTEALGKQAFSLTSWQGNQQVTNSLSIGGVGDLYANGLRLLKKQEGRNTAPSPQNVVNYVNPPEGYVDVTSQFSNIDSYTLYEMIQSGEFFLGECASTKIVDLTNTSNLGLASVDSATLAKAEAEYNAATAKISKKEKELDRQMTKLNTEHEALKTERDSLKEIIQENVDNTFKLFG